MFTTVDAVIISKTDYLPLSDFNLDQFTEAVSGMNPGRKYSSCPPKPVRGWIVGLAGWNFA